MKEIKFYMGLTQEQKDIAVVLIERYEKIVQPEAFEEKKLVLGDIVKPNWACIWNKPINIGKSAQLMATNDKWCIVQFLDKTSDIYRCMDLDGITRDEEIRNIEAVLDRIESKDPSEYESDDRRTEIIKVYQAKLRELKSYR